MHLTKATLDTSSLLQYITTAHLGDGTWKGGCHAFILHWHDQVQKYHALNSAQTLPLMLQQTLLQNAVHPIPELCAIKVQAEQLKAHRAIGRMHIPIHFVLDLDHGTSRLDLASKE